MTSLFLKWHLGLGDAIICNGLVRTLADRYSRVYLPAKYHNVCSVFWMFQDLPNVTVVPVENDRAMLFQAERHIPGVMGLGCWSAGGLRDRNHWDEQFYTDANVPFDQRWDAFDIPGVESEDTPRHPYAFLHHDPARGYRIRQQPTIPIHEPRPMPHLFWNLDLLCNADEIHVIDSAYLNLAESVVTDAKRLVIHAYARHETGLPTLRKNWEILK